MFLIVFESISLNYLEITSIEIESEYDSETIKIKTDTIDDNENDD